MRMRAMSDSLWESRRMSKGRSLRVFVDLAPLSPDGGNGGVRVFVLRLLEALLKRPGAHEIHLLVKPEAEAVVAPLLAKGAVLQRLGPGLDVEEPRRLLRTRRRLHGFFQPLLDLAAPDRSSLKRLGAADASVFGVTSGARTASWPSPRPRRRWPSSACT